MRDGDGDGGAGSGDSDVGSGGVRGDDGNGFRGWRRGLRDGDGGVRQGRGWQRWLRGVGEGSGDTNGSEMAATGFGDDNDGLQWWRRGH
ncbi:hypothetical protein GUJ93_ZPchr0011g27599 [Zizania palustris]|uniref:Uncharacterized protein n=1 Tax=Zizania palustris TaxID=103762 RepID=A0A8J6BPD5_ZIZPA|nr:hypothetical protein GUJ93_ZPchr0011g27599 [Zizania palustris]